MKKLLTIIGNALFVAVLCLSQGIVLAEDKTFSEAELDQMLAPIALYPDSLLAQILMATTYPADVADAVKWSKANPKQEGDAAVEAVQDQSWDASVMSLVAFPQVLDMMGKQVDWVQNVGDAFLADSEGVMDTVQKLRAKARDEGNLETTEQQKVIIEEPSSTETVIIVEPADPQVVYVPAYNPTIVYGTWWWPHYRPWYYYPAGYYGFGTALARGVAFGIGVGITRSLWGGCHWGRGHGSVNINVNNYNSINRNKLNVNSKNTNWKHNSNNRRGVPYRDSKSRSQFENKRGGADKRKDYRGRDAQREKARSTLDKRAVDPADGRKQLQGKGGDRARDSVNKANRDTGRTREAAQNANRDKAKTRDTSKSMKRDQAQGSRQNRDKGTSRNAGSRKASSRDNAFSDVGNAKKSRQSINRGQSSSRSMQNRSGGNRGGGNRGGGHRGGGGGRR